MSFMLSLDKRCQEILKRVIYAGGYLKIQDVADEMSISKRSVYYDINKINDWLQEQGLEQLVQERGKGIYVTSEHARKIQEVLVDYENDIYQVYTPDERTRLEICAIIVRHHALYVEDFMEICQVSRNTIINMVNVMTHVKNKTNNDILKIKC